MRDKYYWCLKVKTIPLYRILRILSVSFGWLICWLNWKNECYWGSPGADGRKLNEIHGCQNQNGTAASKRGQRQRRQTPSDKCLYQAMHHEESHMADKCVRGLQRWLLNSTYPPNNHPITIIQILTRRWKGGRGSQAIYLIIYSIDGYATKLRSRIYYTGWFRPLTLFIFISIAEFEWNMVKKKIIAK